MINEPFMNAEIQLRRAEEMRTAVPDEVQLNEELFVLNKVARPLTRLCFFTDVFSVRYGSLFVDIYRHLRLFLTAERKRGFVSELASNISLYRSGAGCVPIHGP